METNVSLEQEEPTNWSRQAPPWRPRESFKDLTILTVPSRSHSDMDGMEFALSLSIMPAAAYHPVYSPRRKKRASIIHENKASVASSSSFMEVFHFRHSSEASSKDQGKIGRFDFLIQYTRLEWE